MTIGRDHEAFGDLQAPILHPQAGHEMEGHARLQLTHVTGPERHGPLAPIRRVGQTDRIARPVGFFDPVFRQDAKKRLGDWEADTLIGRHHRGAVISLVERKSQFTLLGQVPHKTAEAVRKQMVEQLRPYRRRVHTITTDNGREFAGHEAIAHKLKAKVYFAQPYQAWQRGLNEQVNGLIRQYLPKKTDLRTVTDEQLRLIMNRLNHRPRKTLGFKTPYEVFCNNSRFKNIRVALGS